MAVLKYSYLIFGVLLYIVINVISYTNPNFGGELGMKLLFSTASLFLMTLNYSIILFSERLFHKPFHAFSTYVKVSLYLGVIVTPLISLYYT
ncbi:hypothetical protein [Peloplasma aerotolerans]|jgi:hypothetical protein|uniref:Uncharacterized protein n=1 Tax=Peloplasma aerotolerans TaxID=3044389 RepID=A0AAW6UAV4_9MOLU|nr:hypothetical protein [Mariniplasma sp. M4Ah]MDI6452641.1 hypothetical protein [Mariniplasma sp. M4Ah]MDR4968729.1 hypothetical protein [Acholeplasmataceae bacterium]